MNEGLTPIERLMAKKLGSSYAKYPISHARTQLKNVLSREVETLLRLNGLVRPPFDPFKISHINKIPVRVEFESRGKIGSEGKLEVINDEFVITLDQKLRDRKSLYRLRSSMTHELMHTFFYDTSKSLPHRLGRNSINRKSLLMQEELCHYLTRQFLMPSFSIQPTISKNNSLKSPRIRSLRSLKSIYLVSSDIVAWRFVRDLGLWESIFIKFEKTNGGYKSPTKLRTKSNGFYKKIRIPISIPLKYSDPMRRLIREQVFNASEKEYSWAMAEVDDQQVVVEASLDSRHPVSVVVLVYKSDMAKLTDFMNMDYDHRRLS